MTRVRPAARCVIDTMILQKANAAITQTPKDRSQFRKRIDLLQQVSDGHVRVLLSRKLIQEYREKLPELRNEAIRAFWDLLASPDRVQWNWPPWGGAERSHATKCRFPREDWHLLRTAIRTGERTRLYSEEDRVLVARACILRSFDVQIVDPRR